MSHGLAASRHRGTRNSDRIAVLLVNLFHAEKHPTIGFPLNVESLAGDLSGEFGDSLAVSVFDMQDDNNSLDKLIETIVEQNYDIVGISVKTGQRQIAEKTIDAILDLPRKLRPHQIMIGGHRPRVFPEEFILKYPGQNLLVCYGEGEPTMRAMIRFIRGELALHEVPNLIMDCGQGIEKTIRQAHDLSTWHPPGTSTLPSILQKRGVIYMETSRGCSLDKCTFCCRKFSGGAPPRMISIEKVVSTWKSLQDKGVKHIYCADDDFLMNNLSRGGRLGEALGEASVALHFWVQTTVAGILQLRKRPGLPQRETSDAVDTAETVLGKLKRAGLKTLFLGIESGSDSQLQRYGKGITAEQGSRVIELCDAIGIELEIGLIPFDPFVSLKELRETVDFIRRNKISDKIAKILNLMCLQKGIIMYGITRQAGLITGEREIDTLLYPYRFDNPEIDCIASWIIEWHRDSLSSSMYALRKLVDGDPGDAQLTGYLSEMRKLEFEFLNKLVMGNPEQFPEIYRIHRNSRFSIMEACRTNVRHLNLNTAERLLEPSFSSGSEQWETVIDKQDGQN